MGHTYTLDELSPNSPEHSAWLDGFEAGMAVGAAIIAWAEAIRVNFPCLQGGHFWGWSPGRNADVCQECGHVADENE